MKRTLMVVVSLIMSMCAFAFAACGGNNEDYVLNVNKLNENMTNYKSVSNIKTTMSIDLEALGELAGELSEEELEPEVIEEVEYTVVDGNKTYSYFLEDGEKINEIYASVEGNKTYIYTKEGSEWIKYESEIPYESDFDVIKEGDLVKDGEYYVLSEAKAAEFAEELGGSGMEGVSVEIDLMRFKISDDKVTKAEMKITMSIMGMLTVMETTTTYSDHGKASVTLPTVTEEPAEYVIDYDALNENMSNYKAVANIKTTMSFESEEPSEEEFEDMVDEMVQYIEVDGDVMYFYFLEGGEKVEEAYASVEDGVTYDYVKDGTDWYKSESETTYDSGFDLILEGDLTKEGEYYVLSEAKAAEFAAAMAGEDMEGVDVEINVLRFKISDDKVTEVEMTITMSMMGMTIVMEMVTTYSDHGTVTLTLPTATEVE